MSSKMSKSTTSRRAILAGAAALPIVTVPALAEADDVELLRLAAHVKTAWEEYGDAITVHSAAEERWFAWRHSNPEPDKKSAAWIEWLERQESFLQEIGFDDTAAAQSVASDKLQGAIDTLRNTNALSLRGLSAKARLCEIDPDALGHFLRPSIISDLLALGVQS
jgi:hypothetical protein